MKIGDTVRALEDGYVGIVTYVGFTVEVMFPALGVARFHQPAEVELFDPGPGFRSSCETIPAPPTLRRPPCVCKRCGSLNEFATPNQEDGSYVCFECR